MTMAPERASVRGLGWPSAEQRRLLSVLVAHDPRDAQAAWAAWRADAKLATLDAGSRRLLPLVLRRIRSFGCSDPELDRLRGVARHTWVSNEIHVRAAREVAAALGVAGIPVCALKGFALLEEYHGGDLAWRPMYDVDLLVPADHAPDAAVVLHSLGFESRPRATRRTFATQLVPWGVGHAFQRGHAGIDLHWHVLHQDRSRFFDTVAWDHAVPLSADAPQGLNSLAATEHLIHVCLHGVRFDSMANRIWAVDAIRIVEYARACIDWERLIRLASQRCLSVALLDALSFLASLTQAIPDTVLARLAAIPAPALELLEYRALTQPWRTLDRTLQNACTRMADARRRYEHLSASLLGAPDV